MKHFYKAILIVILLSGIQNLLNAQTIVKGILDPALQIDSFLVSYTTGAVQENNIFAKGIDKSVKVVKGEFTVELTDVPEVFYLRFNFPKEGEVKIGQKYRNFTSSILMLRAKSVTEFKISPLEIDVDGSEKELVECQLALKDLAQKGSTKIIKISNNYRSLEPITSEIIDEYLSIFQNQYDETESEAIELVANYRGKISVENRNQILYDFIGKLRFGEINKLSFKVNRGLKSQRSDIIEFYLKNYLEKNESMIFNKYLGKSYAYPKYLAHKVTIDLGMLLAKVGNRLRPDLQLILDVTAQRYRGETFDQVAFAAFHSRGSMEFIDDKTYSSLLSSINNKEYIDYINRLRESRSKHSKSFQFKLQDETGEIYQNEDFKGKVVLLDFWFTGCRGCIALHKNMEAVKRYFKNNPNVVFLSICIDKDESMWRRSLKSGDYTDEIDTKLWVGVEGSKHPIVRHYDISSYPTMIIVDGSDEVVAMNPPNPFLEKNRKTLINMIENALIH